MYLSTYGILVICLVQALVVEEALGSFKRGRMLGGFVGVSRDLLRSERNFPDLWFEDQLLDHYDNTNEIKWKQRYYVNTEFYKPGGPVFLLINGEGESNPKWMDTGAWTVWAKEFNAMMFSLEHRYYGKSHPTPDLSTKNLRYLSSQQALADAARFIVAMNKEYKFGDNIKWVAFGGSYPGNLVAWIREKYPHLIYAGISSSGPVLAKLNFIEYFEVVEASLRTHSEGCVKAVKNAFSEINILINKTTNHEMLADKLQLCNYTDGSLRDMNNLMNFYESMADNFAGIVQYNKDNSDHSKLSINDICDVMVDQSIGVPFDRFVKVNSMVMNSSSGGCVDYKYDDMVRKLQSVDWSDSMLRQWTYQTCTEFGYYQTSSQNNGLFGGDQFPLELFLQTCRDVYGARFNPELQNDAIIRTNTYYGGLNPQTTNVIYVHGSIDPWHALGITQTIDPNMPAVFINGTAHCADMYTPSDKDMPSLKEARVKILEFLRDVLN